MHYLDLYDEEVGWTVFLDWQEAYHYLPPREVGKKGMGEEEGILMQA